MISRRSLMGSCPNVRPRILKIPGYQQIISAVMRPDGVTLIRLSAFEYVCQIGAFARFHLVSPNGILGHRLLRKPAYEKGRKWMLHARLLVSM